MMPSDDNSIDISIFMAELGWQIWLWGHSSSQRQNTQQFIHCVMTFWRHQCHNTSSKSVI